MRTPSAVNYAPGCGCRVRCDLEVRPLDRWTMDWCPLHQAALELLAACRAALSVLLDAHAALTAELVGGHGKGRCQGGCPDLEAIAMLQAAIAAAGGTP